MPFEHCTQNTQLTLGPGKRLALIFFLHFAPKFSASATQHKPNWFIQIACLRLDFRFLLIPSFLADNFCFANRCTCPGQLDLWAVQFCYKSKPRPRDPHLHPSEYKSPLHDCSFLGEANLSISYIATSHCNRSCRVCGMHMARKSKTDVYPQNNTGHHHLGSFFFLLGKLQFQSL